MIANKTRFLKLVIYAAFIFLIVFPGCQKKDVHTPITSVAGISQENLPVSPELAQALSILRAGRYSRAEKALKDYLESNPENVEAKLNLAHALYEQRKLKEAEIEVKDVLNKNPKSIRARDQLVRIYLERYNYDSAETLAKEAIEINPNSSTGWSSLGYTMLSRCDYKKSREAFEEALKLNPRDSGALTGYGELLFRTGDEEGSEQALIQAIKIDPYESRPHVVLGELYRSQEKYAMSETAFFKALELEPEGNEDTYAELGALYLAQYKIHKAEDAFKKGLTNPRNLHCMADSYTGLGIVAQRLKNYDLAEEYFRKAMKYNPGDPLFYRNLVHNRVLRNVKSIRNIETPIHFGLYYLFPGEIKTFLDRLIKVQPDNYEGQCIQGFVHLWGSNEPEKAKTFFSVASDKDSDERDAALVGLGFGSLLQGRIDDGKKYFNRALEEQHSETPCYLGLGLANLLAWEYSKANTMFDNAIRFSRGDPLVEIEVAYLCYLAKKTRKMQDYITLGMARHSDDPVFQAGLTELYYKIGKSEKALENLQKLSDKTFKNGGNQWPKYISAVISRGGPVDQAENFLKNQAEKFPDDPDFLYFQAVTFARKGENRKALRFLEKTFKIAPGLVFQAEAEPALEKLKQCTSYQEILNRAKNQPGHGKYPPGTVREI
ncbi:MAG: tetratricopeptide repeat protein [Candidatus Eremiobacteraeota bacterium]|nr:tetratricopeptide repeat protein [Candidatus Eremiobacteraeota bacterium]